MDSIRKIGTKKERLLEFNRNWLCNSLRDSELYSPLKVFLEPLYDPKHELWLSEECRFMVTHGLRHVLNVFRYATRLYYDTVHNTENPKRNENFLEEHVDKVCLIVSLWLHDWGMVGPETPDYLKPLSPKERNIKFLKMLNETLEVASEKLGERFSKIEKLRYDCRWIRSIHSLISYFNITKTSQSISLDALGRELEKYDRDLEDIAVICLFHRFPLAKLKEFGKEHLSSLSALLAFLDGCDENWQRLSSMEHVQRIMARGMRKGDEMYQKIDSTLHSENLHLMGIDKGTSKNLRDAWDKGKFAELLGLFDSLLNTSKNREKLVALRKDVEDYKNSFVDQFDEHIEPKLLIKDIYFKNGEIILVPRHKLVSEENPAIKKTIEKIRKHLRDYREGLEKLGLRFTEENIRLWKPKDGPPERLEIPEIVSPESQRAREILNLIEQGEGQCLEFKSSLRVDTLKRGMSHRDVEYQVAKAICGFLNTIEGGKLLIGVHDKGQILGLKGDYESLSGKTKRAGRDAFRRQLHQVIRSRLRPKTGDIFVDVSFSEVKGKDVCLIDIRPWLKHNDNIVCIVKEKEGKKEEIPYVRKGTEARPLGSREAIEYITKLLPLARLVVPSREKLIDKLNGEQLEESLFSSPASKEEVFDFYCGGQISWRIIAANGDIRRDQEEKIVDQALQRGDNFRIVCIVAEPGAGKTTVLWRIAYELFRKGEIVIRFYNDNPEVWHKLSELAEQIGRPFYILIDDIFRNPDFVEALQKINKDNLPVTILATSRSAQYHEGRLARFMKKIELKLSFEEKTSLLERLGKSYEQLFPDLQRKFDQNDLFLVLGMVLTHGKGFDEIIREMIEELDHGDKEYPWSPRLCRAFEYVCFSHSYGFSIPEQLLGGLDEKGRFSGILENERARGVFYEETRPGYPTRFIRTGAELIAEKALSHYGRRPNIFGEILEAADEHDQIQRRYIVNLTSAILDQGTVKNAQDTITKSEKIYQVLNHATISELDVWRRIFRQLNLGKRAKECTENLLLRRPISAQDCQILISELSSQSDIHKAFYTASTWMKEHPEDRTIFPRYLSLTWKIGNQKQKDEAIKETILWLKDHPEDNAVRQAYIILIRERGNRTQVRRAIEDTISWLKEHPDNSNVRSVFISFINKKGFLKLEDIRRVLEDIEQYMEKHSPHPLFDNYITLIRKVEGTKINVEINSERVYKAGRIFLDSCEMAVVAKAIENFANWIRDRRNYKEAEQIYAKLESAGIKHLKTRAGISYGYAKVLLGQAMEEENFSERVKKLYKAEKKFREALGYHQGHHMARAFLAIVLREQGEDEKAESELNHAEWWAPFDKKKDMILVSSLPFESELASKLNRGIIPKDIKKDFDARNNSLSQDAKVVKVENVKNRWKITDKDANRNKYYIVITERSETDEKYTLSTYGGVSFGEIPYKIGVFYYNFNLPEEARYWLKMASTKDEENFANWWNLGRADMDLALDLENQGRYGVTEFLFNESLSSLEIALEKAPKVLQLPASRDIPDRINEVKKHLEKIGERGTFTVRAFKGRDGKTIARAIDGRIVLFDYTDPKSSLVQPGDSVNVRVVKVTRTYLIVRVVR